ncbi:hypothetical protein CDL15_Pgr007353 [Punica granatum]|uniref:GDSL esterase/lipase At4g26790-like n=1 Tax=Punica granatum TaxID=22663 RepID=A0A218X7Y6_PUNGR|nr:hypothetical protein CDL15_Pgr007353 [Punica granatum]
MARKSIITNLYFLSHFVLQLLETSAKVPSIIVFGDSSVDSGNNNHISTVVKSNFKPYGRDFYGGQATGRFSNGRVCSDFISEAFEINPTIPAYLDPAFNITDFSTGVCFASAGTGYDNSTSDVLSVIPLWKELEYYKKYQEELRAYMGRVKADNVLRESLYLISVGTNDFLENYYLVPGRSLQYSIEGYQSFLLGIARNFVSELYGLGARKISLSGLPPMGCLPLERTRSVMFGNRCVEKYNNVAKEFNGKLEDLVEKLNKELEGIQVVVPNPYGILFDIIQNPESYGFENAVEACCGTGLFEMGYLCNKNNPFTCADASKYVFWDSFHPTEKTNGLVARHAVKTCLYKFM